MQLGQTEAWVSSPHDAPSPLSLRQTLWWHLDHLYGTANSQWSVRLGFRGRLDRQALRSAFERLVARHATLRARFELMHGTVCRCIESAGYATAFSEDDLDGQWRADRLCKAYATTPLDLREGPLCRGWLMQLPDQEYVLLITLHPMICGHASIAALLRDLLTLYRSGIRDHVEGSSPHLGEYCDSPCISEMVLASSNRSGESAWLDWRGGAPCDESWISTLGWHRSECPAARAAALVKVEPGVATKVRAVAQHHHVEIQVVLAASFISAVERVLDFASGMVGIEVIGNMADLELVAVCQRETIFPVRVGKEVRIPLSQRIIWLARLFKEGCGDWGGIASALEPALRTLNQKPLFPVIVGVDPVQTKELTAVALPGLSLRHVTADFWWPCSALSVYVKDDDQGMTASLRSSVESVDRAAVDRLVTAWLNELRAIDAWRSETAV